MKTPVLTLVLLAFVSAPILADESPAGLQRLDFMVGKWRGTSDGEPGKGTVDRECWRILKDRFVECRTTSTYAPQEKNPKGEVHVAKAIYSFDKKTKTLRLRQFHGEGFVNSYVEGEAMVSTTLEIENIPAGWRARETYKQSSMDSFEEKFELAEPGKEFAVYSASTFERVK
jgi:hypothetical protein